ncbi:MAG: phosphoglycerate kinase, partial [Candidatus Aenigmatarchaeota archaeon]
VKIFDYFDLIDKSLEEGKVDKILASGTLGELCIIAEGKKLGKKESFLGKKDSMEKKSLLDLVPKVRSLLDQHPDVFEVPEDLAEDDNGRKEISTEDLPTDKDIWDIGTKTAERFAGIIKKARTIYLKGAPGDYRITGFSKGSEIVIKAIASSDAYSLIGGGSAADLVGLYSDKGSFSHVSLAGGALMEYMSGKKLPALEFLASG